MNNADQYKFLYVAISDSHGVPTMNDMDAIVDICRRDFPDPLRQLIKRFFGQPFADKGLYNKIMEELAATTS